MKFPFRAAVFWGRMFVSATDSLRRIGRFGHEIELIILNRVKN